MNLGTALTISDILQCVNIAGLVLGYFWIKPLRQSRKEINSLREELGAARITDLRKDLDSHSQELTDHESRLRRIDNQCPIHEGKIQMEINKQVERMRGDDREQRRQLDRRVDDINREIGEVRTMVGNVNEWLQKIDTRVAQVAEDTANLAGRQGL
jgi:chromosome segregation ATPase